MGLKPKALNPKHKDGLWFYCVRRAGSFFVEAALDFPSQVPGPDGTSAKVIARWGDESTCAAFVARQNARR